MLRIGRGMLAVFFDGVLGGLVQAFTGGSVGAYLVGLAMGLAGLGIVWFRGREASASGTTVPVVGGAVGPQSGAPARYVSTLKGDVRDDVVREITDEVVASVGKSLAHITVKPPLRVMVYIDYPNFYLNWKAETGKTLLNWDVFVPNLLRRLNTVVGLEGETFRLSGAHVYASFIPYKILADNKVPTKQIESRYLYGVRGYLEGHLAALPGFFVHIFDRSVMGDPGNPNRDGSGIIKSEEKGVDTSIIADMLVHASQDSYDIAVLASNDRDFVPGIRAVQNHFKKKVVHLGFRRFPYGVSGAAWDDLLIDKGFRKALIDGDLVEDKPAQTLTVEDLPKLTEVDLQEGRIFRGVVTGTTYFGAFVEFGGPHGAGLVYYMDFKVKAGEVANAVDVGDAVYVEFLSHGEKGTRLGLKNIDQTTGERLPEPVT